MISYGRQSVSEEDIKALCDVLRSEYLTTGPAVAAFEQDFAEKVGSRYAVAVANGTAALHLCALAAGISSGDEVIVSPLTFVASVNCVLYADGTPVFVDIHEQTGLMNAALIEQAITKKTKAIIPIHYAGLPCDMKEIRKIAKEHDLVVIEDACHALGARYEDSKVGDCTYSDMSIFSFHPVKHITTGEGGMITTNSERLYKKLLLLRNHGLTKDSTLLVMKDEGGWHQEMHTLGYNYRLTDFQSCLGRTQLKKLDAFVERRREIAAVYDREFEGMPEVTPLSSSEGLLNAYHLYVIKVPDGRVRRELYEYLKDHDICCQVHYLPVYLQPFYRKKCFEPGLCPVAEKFYERILSLPVFFELTNQEQATVIEKIKLFFSSRQ
jgi:perosamine synthetase